MASFRAFFEFKERIPNRVTFKVTKKSPIVLKIEKEDFQPLKLVRSD